MNKKLSKKLDLELWGAIVNIQPEVVKVLCSTHTELVTDYRCNGESTWLNECVKVGNVGLVETLLDLGFNVNALRLPEKSSAVTTAIGFDYEEIVSLLIQRGADLNLSRPLIASLSPSLPPERRMYYVRELVENGADVNRTFELYGDPDSLFTTLDWAGEMPEIAAYLRAHGAKTLAEL